MIASQASFWFYQMPNLALAAMMYTLLGRFVMGLFMAPDSQMVLWRVFCQITDPVLKAVGALTPQIVPPPLVLVFAVVWLLVLRMVLFLTLMTFGVKL